MDQNAILKKKRLIKILKEIVFILAMRQTHFHDLFISMINFKILYIEIRLLF